MANTYELISSSTVGIGTASSITFTSIPSTYTDLILKVSARTLTAAVGDALYVTYNGGGSVTAKRLQGNGAAASSDTDASGAWIAGATATASTFGSSDYYIPNYAGSTIKSSSADSVSENNATTAYAALMALSSSATAAINSITIISESGSNFVQYSTAYLYGVKNA
jgi:hypothetical protein